MLPFHVIPPFLQEIIIINITQFYPSALPLYISKDSIAMIAVHPIQNAIFRRCDATGRGNLGDVDVGLIVFDVFVDGQGNRGERDCTPEKPAYALLLRR